MLVFTLLIQVLSGTQILDSELKRNIAIIQRHIEHEEQIYLQKNTFAEISNFSDLGYAIDMSVVLKGGAPNSPQICIPFYSMVTLRESESEIDMMIDDSYIDLDQLTVEDLENLGGEQLQAMTHTKNGILVTSNKNLFLFTISDHSTGHKAIQTDKRELSLVNNNYQEVPQLLYDYKNDFAFLIHSQNKTKFRLSKDQFESDFLPWMGWNPRNQTFMIKVAKGFLYACVGYDGLDIYQIKEDGDLIFIKNLNSSLLYNDSKDTIKIVDLEVSGYNQEYLYVLDQLKGITQLNIKYSDGDEPWKAKINTELGLIPCKEGVKFEIYNNQTLIVIIEQSVYSFAVEFYLGKDQSWFELNKYQMRGRLRDVDISKDFAVLTGIDTHIVLKHSIYAEFQSKIRPPNQSKFYAGGLMALDFLTNSEGEDELIFGITGKGLILYDWDVIRPSIICLTFASGIEGQNFLIQADYKTTNCTEKQAFLNENKDLIEPLVACQTKEIFKIKIMEPYLTEKDRDTIVFVILGVGLLLLLVILGLFCSYRRYQVQRENFERDIVNFENRARRQSRDEKIQVEK